MKVFIAEHRASGFVSPLLPLRRQHDTCRSATVGSIEQLKSGCSQRCVQRIGKFGASAAAGVANLSSLLAGGLCNGKTAEGTGRFQYPCVRSVGACVTDGLGRALEIHAETRFRCESVAILGQGTHGVAPTRTARSVVRCLGLRCSLSTREIVGPGAAGAALL